MIPSCLVLLAVSVILLVDEPGGLPIAGIVLFGGFLALRAADLVARQVMLGVDASGVTLRTPGPFGRKAVVPWRDLREVVLWKKKRHIRGLPTTIHYVGLRRRKSAPRLPGSVDLTLPSKLEARVNSRLKVPRQVEADSRPVLGWRLDRERLAEAVAHFAPQVEVVDRG